MLTELRITTSAFQTNHLVYALVDDNIFAFFRFPDESDAADPVYLVAINFGDDTVTSNFVTSAVEYDVTLESNGEVAISSEMDKNGDTVELNALALNSGEALVIQVDAVYGSPSTAVPILTTSSAESLISCGKLSLALFAFTQLFFRMF